MRSQDKFKRKVEVAVSESLSSKLLFKMQDARVKAMTDEIDQQMIALAAKDEARVKAVLENYKDYIAFKQSQDFFKHSGLDLSMSVIEDENPAYR